MRIGALWVYLYITDLPNLYPQVKYRSSMHFNSQVQVGALHVENFSGIPSITPTQCKFWGYTVIM